MAEIPESRPFALEKANHQDFVANADEVRRTKQGREIPPMPPTGGYPYGFGIKLVTILYELLLALGIIVSVVFIILVILTGKGDAMSGSSSVRTTFKGKASFDDLMAKILLGLAASFMVLTILINITSNYTTRTADKTLSGINAPARK